jgi:hypothetical protein
MTYYRWNTASLTAIGRRLVVASALVTVALTLLGGARAWSVAANSRRAQESEARQSHLYRQLADKDAVLESQRRIYMERFRRLEALVREREQDLTVLRARLVDRDLILVRDSAIDNSSRVPADQQTVERPLLRVNVHR